LVSLERLGGRSTATQKTRDSFELGGGGGVLLSRNKDTSRREQESVRQVSALRRWPTREQETKVEAEGLNH